MKKNRIVIFKEFLNELREVYLKNGEDGLMKDYDWAVYFSDDMIESESSCCVADDVTVDDDDEEIYSEFAINNGMEYVVYGEIICDVLANCFMQNSNCEVSEMVDAINYYLEYDNYMDL